MGAATRRHRGVACFYGLLDVLRAPLARFVAEAAPQVETRGGSGVHAQLRALLDHLVGRFPDDVRRDMELLVRVETQIFSEGDAGDVESAIAAATRLLEAFAGDGDGDTKKAAQDLFQWLCIGLEPVESDEEEDTAEDRRSEGGGCNMEIGESRVIPVGDDRGDQDAEGSSGKLNDGVEVRVYGDVAVEDCDEESYNNDASSARDPDDVPTNATALSHPSAIAVGYDDDSELKLTIAPLQDDRCSRVVGTVGLENEEVEKDSGREELDLEELSVASHIHVRHSLSIEPSMSDIDQEEEDEEGGGNDDVEDSEDDEAGMVCFYDEEAIAVFSQRASDASGDTCSVGSDEAAEYPCDAREAVVLGPSAFDKHTTLQTQQSLVMASVTPTNTGDAAVSTDKPLGIDLEALQSDLEVRTNALVARVTEGDKPSSQLQAAIQQLSGRDFGAAIFSINQELVRAKTKPVNHASLYGLLARCRFELKQYESMLEDAESGLALDASSADSYYWVILALDLLGRQLDAIHTCVVGLAAVSEQHDLVRLKNNLLDKVITTNTGEGISSRRKDLLKKGLAKSASRDHSDAAAIFTELLSLAGSHKQAAPVYMHRARCYMKLKQYGLAAQDASIALAVAEINVVASETLCEALLEMGKPNVASMICSKALADSPMHGSLTDIQMRIKYFKNRKPVDEPRAKAPIKRTTAYTRPQGTAWEQELKQLVSLGLRSNHTAAMKLFDKALLLLENVDVSTTNCAAVTAKKLSVLGHKARFALAKEDFQSAIDPAKRGLGLNPNWVEGHRLVCKALMGLGKWSDALHACEQVLARVPHDEAFQIYRPDIASKLSPAAPTQPAGATRKPTESTTEAAKNCSPARQARVQELLQTGLTHQSKSKHKEAEADFSKALAVLNEAQTGKEAADVSTLRGELHGHRARCRLAMEQFQAAADDARAGMVYQPDWVDGDRLLCYALMAQRAWREAVDVCDRVLARAPDDVIFMKFKHRLLEKPETHQKVPEAGQLQALSIPSVQQEFQSLCDQAMKLIKERDFRSAESCCSDAIDLLKTNHVVDSLAHQKASVYFSRARCQANFGAFDRMLLAVRAGLTYNPHGVEGHRLECIALMQLGRWCEAKSACDRVLAQSPEDGAFLKHRADIAANITEAD